MAGQHPNPTKVCPHETFWGWLGGFLGISLVAAIDQYVLSGSDLLFIIGSFGASAVLIYGAIESPLAQPRNLVGGHVISALVGVTVCRICPAPAWVAAAMAVSFAIAAMHLTKTLHPPGGATALIAVIGSPRIHAIGYGYVLMPVAAGALVMLVVALVVNNIPKRTRYPRFWL